MVLSALFLQIAHPASMTFSSKDDLRARCLFVKLSHGYDAVDLVAEIFGLQMKHVYRGAASVDLAAGVVDHGDEFADWGNVDLVHLLLHHLGGKSRHARYRTEQRGHVHSWISHCGNL